MTVSLFEEDVFDVIMKKRKAEMETDEYQRMQQREKFRIWKEKKDKEAAEEAERIR